MDTVYIEFTSKPVEEIQEISENVYVDLNADENLVLMTVEHASQNASSTQLAFERIGVGEDEKLTA